MLTESEAVDFLRHNKRAYEFLYFFVSLDSMEQERFMSKVLADIEREEETAAK